MYRERIKTLTTVGTIPYSSIGQRINISNRLKKEYKWIEIDVMEGFLYYQVYEKKQSNLIY